MGEERRGGKKEGRKEAEGMQRMSLGMGGDQGEEQVERGTDRATDWPEFLASKGVCIMSAEQLSHPLSSAAASSFLFPRHYWLQEGKFRPVLNHSRQEC